jgi:RNA polymerase sigma-70 factor (ECF subfamily)
MDVTRGPAHPGIAGMEAFACVSLAWEAHEAELRGFIRHGLGDEHAADDLLQDTFVKAMREGQGFCSLDDPRAWLFRVARNAMTDRFRGAKVTDPIEQHADSLPMAEPESAPPVDALTACLARVLSELPPEDAEVLRACDIEGRTQKHFAAAQGLSLPAAKSRLLRARQRLRDRMAVACRVQFDPDDGRVSGHGGREGEAKPACGS